jgi:hypothetical protein
MSGTSQIRENRHPLGVYSPIACRSALDFAWIWKSLVPTKADGDSADPRSSHAGIVIAPGHRLLSRIHLLSPPVHFCSLSTQRGLSPEVVACLSSTLKYRTF